MLASLYVAGICLVMFFCVQGVLRFDAGSEFGPVGAHLIKAACYVLSIVFLAGFVVEAGHLLAT